MRDLIRAVGAWAALVCVHIAAPSLRAATIGASGDNAKPSTISTYNIANGVNITENVALDPNAGPWLKDLVATTNMASGAGRNITEVLTNLGGGAWSDWHEQIVTRTTINQPNDAPGFLFRQNNLTVLADYGSGFVPLTQGTDYSVTPTNYSGPGSSGNNNNWEAFDINLVPARFIGPGNRLQIQKEIFEVFLDGDIWMTGEAARISEFPTNTGVPEPMMPVAALSTLTLGFLRRSSGARRREKDAQRAFQSLA